MLRCDRYAPRDQQPGTHGAAGARVDPHTGAIFCFRGRKSHIIKILAHDDQGFCLFTKRIAEGCFAWPNTKDQVTVSLTKAELSLLLDGIDWRRPNKIYRPSLAG